MSKRLDHFVGLKKHVKQEIDQKIDPMCILKTFDNDESYNRETIRNDKSNKINIEKENVINKTSLPLAVADLK